MSLSEALALALTVCGWKDGGDDSERNRKVSRKIYIGDGWGGGRDDKLLDFSYVPY